MAMARQSLRMNDLRRFRGSASLPASGAPPGNEGTDPEPCCIAGPIPPLRTFLLDSAPGARRLYRAAAVEGLNGLPGDRLADAPACETPRPEGGRRHGSRQGAEKSTAASTCLLYTSPSPRDVEESRMPSSA